MAMVLNAKMLPAVLSVIAGSVDAISFLGLGGLFTAHVTGNLVVLVAHLATGSRAPVANILSVPVFVAALGLTRLLADVLEKIGLVSLRPLLLVQLLLLVGFLALCASAGARLEPHATRAILAGMLGVSAMAVQNALGQISLKGSAVNRRHDDQHHALHDGYRRDDGRSQSIRCRQGARPREADLAGDRRLRNWMRSGSGMRDSSWPYVPDFACGPRCARGCDGEGHRRGK